MSDIPAVGHPGPGYATMINEALDGVQIGANEALARDPALLIVGPITRDSNGAATAADILWPDGTEGTYVADEVSVDFPGAVDAYTITYGDPATITYTQPAVTRDPVTGEISDRPAMVVS